MREGDRNAKASLIGLCIIFLVAAEWFSPALAVQTPINVVSAIWITSEATYETSRVWTEIDAAPGDKNIRLRVTVQNLSNSTISGLTANLILQYPFKNVTAGDVARAYYSGSIAPGVNAYVDFFLDIDLAAIPGQYKLKMVLSYLELAVGVGKTLYFLKSTEVEVPVIVSSTRYMVVYSVLLSPLTTVPAGNITISGNLLNVGKISALNTNVTVDSSVLRRPVSIIVGQIDPNVPRPFSALMQVRRDLAPGTYSITVSVTYSDSMAVSHISQIEVRLMVRQPAPPTPPPTRGEGDILSLLVQILRNLVSALLGLAESVSKFLLEVNQ